MEGFVVDQVSKTYMDENQRPFQVLHNVAFSWSSGENIAVLGESGSGKSTLARLLIGIEKPNSGTITWNGERYYPLEVVHMAGKAEAYSSSVSRCLWYIKSCPLRLSQCGGGPPQPNTFGQEAKTDEN